MAVFSVRGGSGELAAGTALAGLTIPRVRAAEDNTIRLALLITVDLCVLRAPKPGSTAIYSSRSCSFRNRPSSVQAVLLHDAQTCRRAARGG